MCARVHAFYYLFEKTITLTFIIIIIIIIIIIFPLYSCGLHHCLGRSNYLSKN